MVRRDVTRVQDRFAFVVPAVLRIAVELKPVVKRRVRPGVAGQRGEEAAYFYLRQRGYVIVARNYRPLRHRGEIDLIGWDQDELCFIEVKTRSSRAVMPAEAAVDVPKQAMLRATARTYLRKIKEIPPLRFDVVSLYYEREGTSPDIILFRNAFPVT